MGLSTAMDIANTSLATNAGLQAIVSRNVSNAQNTSGYVSAKVGNVITGMGGGAIIASISNLTNASLFNAMLAGTSKNGEAQALSDGVTLLQKTVADATSTTESTTAAKSPSTLLQALNSAMQTYSSSPSNPSAGAAVVTAAKNLAYALNDATTATQNVRKTADEDMVTSVATINRLLTQFQAVDTQIVKGTGTDADLTDALDERSALLQSLSKEIGISTVSNSNGSMSIYTDSGVTLYQVSPRTVTMQATTVYAAGDPKTTPATPTTTGQAVYIDGVPVTGANAFMPIQSGALAGYANLRDNVAVSYQSQLDNIAGGLISAFAESNASGAKVYQGLFTYSSNATATVSPASSAGLAGMIQVNAGAYPPSGAYTNIRDGGVNGNATPQNSTNAASYNALILGYIGATTATNSGTLSGNLPSTTPAGAGSAGPSNYSQKTSILMSDAQGAPQTVDVYFLKTAANAWDVRAYDPNSTPANTLVGSQTLTFNASGALPAGTKMAIVVPGAGSNTMSLDLSGMTQTASAYSISQSTSSITSYSAESASWLNGMYQTSSNDATYQTTLLSQASQALSNATGVNIDQQMSKMLEYENSYQASAKLISTINSMFNSLLQAVS